MSTAAASGRLAALGDGYVRIWRRVLRSPLWRRMTSDHVRVWLTLLMIAEWKDRTHVDQRTGEHVLVQRGEVKISQRELAELARVSRKAVRNALDLLSTDHDGDGPFLILRRGPKGVGENDEIGAQERAQDGAHGATHISIVNFARYQDSDEHEGPSQGPGTGQEWSPGDPPLGPLLFKKDQEGRSSRARSSKSGARATSTKQPSMPEVVIPTEAWELADRHRALTLKQDPDHSCGTGRWSKRQWAQQYAELCQDSPGAGVEWWDRLRDLLEFAYHGAPAWRDGTPYWSHTDNPRKFIACLDDLRRKRSANGRGAAGAQQGGRPLAIPQECP